MSIKISELPEATSVSQSDLIPIVQDGTTKKATAGIINTDNYSTGEHIVGTWIDGKPLYEITQSKTVPTVTTDGTAVSNNIDIGYNLETIFIQNAFIEYSGGGSVWPCPYYNNSMRVIKAQITENSSGLRRVQITSDGTAYNNSTLFVTVRYTKTTDTATRGIVEQTRGLTKGGIDEDNMITPVEESKEEEKKDEEPIEKKSEEVVKDNNEVSGEELKDLGDEPVDEQTK